MLFYFSLYAFLFLCFVLCCSHCCLLLASITLIPCNMSFLLFVMLFSILFVFSLWIFLHFQCWTSEFPSLKLVLMFSLSLLCVTFEALWALPQPLFFYHNLCPPSWVSTTRSCIVLSQKFIDIKLGDHFFILLTFFSYPHKRYQLLGYQQQKNKNKIEENILGLCML